MLSTVLSDTRMCRKGGFGWALWSVKTDCTLYGKALLFFFSPITLQVTSHSSPILPSIVSLTMNKSSKFKGLQTNSPWHLSGGNLSNLEIKKVQWEFNLLERGEGCIVENYPPKEIVIFFSDQNTIWKIPKIWKNPKVMTHNQMRVAFECHQGVKVKVVK